MTATTLDRPADASDPPPPARPFKHWGAAVGGAVVLAIILFVILFQWNWLRGPLARAISGRLHRPVAITGALEVHPWSWSPRATIHGLVIGNPPWAGKAPMATLPALTVQVKILPLLAGKVLLPLVEADRPDVRLRRDGAGRANWNFSNSATPQPLRLPAINHLVIADGALSLDDTPRGLRFRGTISSNERVSGAGRGVFSLEGQGTLNGQPFAARVTGGPLIHVDPNRPYPFDARLTAGPTRLAISGAIAHPFDLAQVSGKLRLTGPDLSDLYHLTGLALPSTPPYDLAAGFGRFGADYALRRIAGRIGDSDMAGALEVNDRTGRPLVTATLGSRRLRLIDLAAVIGAAPRRIAGHTVSPAQKIESARLAAQHRIFPDARLHIDRMRAMDARLTYRAASVDAGRLPIRALAMKLVLDHGVLTINPLEMTLPQGKLAGLIRLDARRKVPVTEIDLRLSGAQVQNMIARRGSTPPLGGGLFARAKLTGAGDSVRAAAASADGSVSLVMPHGMIRSALAELMGINAARGLFLLITKNHGETPLRCAVADFQARGGVLQARRIVFDTGVVLATGAGQIDLRNETMNLTLDGKPKKFRLIRIDAPLTLKGSLTAPRFGVDIVKAAPQAILAGVAVAVVSPLAAILPFVAPGLAKDADCAALVGEARTQGAPTPGR